VRAPHLFAHATSRRETTRQPLRTSRSSSRRASPPRSAGWICAKRPESAAYHKVRHLTSRPQTIRRDLTCYRRFASVCTDGLGRLIIVSPDPTPSWSISGTKSPYRSGWIRPIKSSRYHRSLRAGCSDDGRRLGVNNRCQSSILILMAKSKTKSVRMLLVRRMRVLVLRRKSEISLWPCTIRLSGRRRRRGPG
jgi:hypothetical protein